MKRKDPFFCVSIRQNPRPAPFDGRTLRRLVASALKTLDVEWCDLRILVVDDVEMAVANLRFLGHEGTTNVISFPEEERSGSNDSARLSGDILLSAPTCLAQTKGWEGTKEERVFFFILHGVLHLMGFDHTAGKEEARRMRKKETTVYARVLRGGAA